MVHHAKSCKHNGDSRLAIGGRNQQKLLRSENYGRDIRFVSTFEYKTNRNNQIFVHNPTENLQNLNSNVDFNNTSGQHLRDNSTDCVPFCLRISCVKHINILLEWP